MITFARENLDQAWDEAQPLFAAHYDEAAAFDVGLAVARERYQAAEAADVLRVFTARDDGKLIGYATISLSRHPHFADSVQARQDALYLAPQYRNGVTGRRFIQFCDAYLKCEGVQVMHRAVTAKRDFSRLLTRMGYAPIETVYSRRLDD